MSAGRTADLADVPVATLALRALAQGRIVLPVLRRSVIPMLHRPVKTQAIAIADSIDRRALFNTGFLADLRDVTEVLTDEMNSQLVVETMWSDHDCDVLSIQNPIWGDTL